MIDITKLSDIHPSLTVKINVRDQFPKTEIGKIIVVKSKVNNPNGIEVSIEGGIIGNVIEVINSPEIAKNKILSETEYVENKENFTEPVMKNEVIPKTIQSFLNSLGGSVYIGVVDDPTAGEEKIIGLKHDRDYYELSGPISDSKFQDKLISDIEDVLMRTLSSTTRLGPLLDYEFHNINGKMILEIIIKSSNTPIFYKHYSRQNKEIVFDVGVTQNKTFTCLFQRKLDDFYLRDGSKKRPLETFEEFSTYFYDHFKNI